MRAAGSLAFALVVALSFGPAASAARRVVQAASIEAQIRNDRPVRVVDAEIRGTLHLPLEVGVPVALERDLLIGTLVASSSSFDRVFSLKGSILENGADFAGAAFSGPTNFAGLHSSGRLSFEEATFRGAALFGGAQLGGPVTFQDAELDGVARFRVARFEKLADFDSASFRAGADFVAARFDQAAYFETASFGDLANFTGAMFSEPAYFGGSLFAGSAAFTGAQFDGRHAPAASFLRARFEDDASFLDASFRGWAKFDLAEAPGDVVFDGAIFGNGASFSTVRLLGDTSFAQTDVSGLLNFDQAVLAKLDLDGASFEPSGKVLLPRAAGTTGRVDELRFDPNDIHHVGIVVGSLKSVTQAREHALALVESEARRGGDVSAANHAYALRQSLDGSGHSWIVRALWLAFWWGVAGYLVAPLHPLVTLVVLLFAFTLARMLRGARFAPAFGCGWSSLWLFDIRKASFVASLEAIAFKTVIVLLFLNLANVWPPLNELVKGVFT